MQKKGNANGDGVSVLGQRDGNRVEKDGNQNAENDRRMRENDVIDTRIYLL